MENNNLTTWIKDHLVAVLVVIAIVCVFGVTTILMGGNGETPDPKPTVKTEVSTQTLSPENRGNLPYGGDGSLPKDFDSNPSTFDDLVTVTKGKLKDLDIPQKAQDFKQWTSKNFDKLQEWLSEEAEHYRNEPDGDVSGLDYSRSYFGDGWASVDGCDVRNIVLQRDLTDKTMLDSCRVQGGVLSDPYTGRTIHFERGDGEVEIDHIVPLSYAWKNGADKWSTEQRIAFANDTDNLLAVNKGDNRAKSDKSPEQWLPRINRCEYSQKFAEIAENYGLTYNQDFVSRICEIQ